MRHLIEQLDTLAEARGGVYVQRLLGVVEQFLRETGDELAKIMQKAGWDTTRVRAEGGMLWADFKSRPGANRDAPPDFVPPKYVRFWVNSKIDGRAEITMDLPTGFQSIGTVNLADPTFEVGTPESFAMHLAMSGGRDDLLGTWG